MTEQDQAPNGEDADVSTMTLVSRLLALESRPSVQALRPLRDRVIERGLQRENPVPAPTAVPDENRPGRFIRTGDLIDARRIKYFQHTVRDEQWPSGTSFEEFIESLVAVVDDDRGGVLVDRRPKGWRLTFSGRSGNWQGIYGGPVIIVMYDCADDGFVTAFQTDRGFAYVEGNEQLVDGVWLRRMR
jgi:hypothetical protein